MYRILKKHFSMLNSEDKKELLRQLNFDKTRLSKKINGKYSLKNDHFNDFEKELIFEYLKEKLSLNYSFQELFTWEEKEISEILKCNNLIANNFSICIERKKDFDGLTEQRMAYDLGIAINTLRNYKNGVTEIPYSMLEEKIPVYFDVTPKFLIGYEKIPLPYYIDPTINEENYSDRELIELFKKRIETNYIIENKSKFSKFLDENKRKFLMRFEEMIVEEFYETQEDISIYEKDRDKKENYFQSNEFYIEMCLTCVNQLWMISKGYIDETDFDFVIYSIESFRKSLGNEFEISNYGKWYFEFLNNNEKAKEIFNKYNK